MAYFTEISILSHITISLFSQLKADSIILFLSSEVSLRIFAVDNQSGKYLNTIVVIQFCLLKMLFQFFQITLIWLFSLGSQTTLKCSSKLTVKCSSYTVYYQNK